MTGTGAVVILNGTPRAGKSSIAAAMQDQDEGVWLNLGVDHFKAATPDRWQPGIGLRPGGERPDLEPLIVRLYQAMYDAVAAHARLGLNVVVDAGHHECYSRPLGILPRAAARLRGLPSLFVGVRCPLEVVMERRIATWNVGYAPDGEVPEPVRRWQHEVHAPWSYDLELDSSASTPTESAAAIMQTLTRGPGTALPRIAGDG